MNRMNPALLVIMFNIGLLRAEMLVKIAHRGASGYVTENTLVAFERAIELGADMIELDVWCSLDGHVMVYHDKWLNRLCNEQGAIEQKALCELKGMLLDHKHTMPTLYEALAMIDGRIKVDIELKGNITVSAVISCIKDFVDSGKFSWQDFLITSFNHHLLRLVKDLEPQVLIGAIFEGLPIGYCDVIQDLDVDVVVLAYSLTNSAIVHDAHKRGVKVFVYTVNHAEDVLDMKLLGVDGIISNYPDLI